MKKQTTLILLLLCCCFVTQAQTPQVQNTHKIVAEEPNVSDILSVLGAMNIEMFRFNLSGFLSERYEVSMYIDEYENNNKKQRAHLMHFGDNIRSLNDVPEEHRADFRKVKQIPEGKNEWNNIDFLSIYLQSENDSTSMVTFNALEGGMMSCPLKLRIVGDCKRPFYQARPFTLGELPKGDLFTIPLVLYGSGWQDGQMIRFCGESEIDPEMKAEILTKTPHHYVLGLELKKK